MLKDQELEDGPEVDVEDDEDRGIHGDMGPWEESLGVFLVSRVLMMMT